MHLGVRAVGGQRRRGRDLDAILRCRCFGPPQGPLVPLGVDMALVVPAVARVAERPEDPAALLPCGPWPQLCQRIPEAHLWCRRIHGQVLPELCGGRIVGTVSLGPRRLLGLSLRFGCRLQPRQRRRIRVLSASFADRLAAHFPLCAGIEIGLPRHGKVNLVTPTTHRECASATALPPRLLERPVCLRGVRDPPAAIYEDLPLSLPGNIDQWHVGRRTPDALRLMRRQRDFRNAFGDSGP
mmetsp:Transcript_71781/g.207907  ORF Transcript_71781/g.207907 Transcript_71781/m.207907 type:complete len:240 (-) Transcript_71781:238-957(-)